MSSALFNSQTSGGMFAGLAGLAATLALVATSGAAEADEMGSAGLRYPNAQSLYLSVNMTPIGKRDFEYSVGESVRIDDFAISAYDDGLFFDRGRLSLLNLAPSARGIREEVSCVLSGDEATQFASGIRKYPSSKAYLMHPWGFTHVAMEGEIKFIDYSNAVVMVVDPCHVVSRDRWN